MSSTRREKAPSSCIISKISSLVRPSCNRTAAIIWSVGASSSYDKPLVSFVSQKLSSDVPEATRIESAAARNLDVT
jgi:hypothetical protein